MALSDKNILITPNIGQSADPKIVFSGADASLGAQNITLNVYPTSSGTLSFEGSAGQLFSVSNSLSGTIYSVNDVSGIPSIEVLDTGLIKFGQYGGNVVIGSGTDNGAKLQVNGGISTPTMWVNYSTSNFNAYNENIRLFAAGNGASVIAFNASGTSGSPAGAVLGYSDRIEIRSTSDSIVHRFYNNYSVALSSSRAPIFYDSDDTGYYIDPNSTGNSALRMRGGALFGPNTSWSAYLYIGTNGNVDVNTATVATTNGNLHIDAANGNTIYLNNYATSSYTIISQSTRSPIFYDSNDTGYYWNPNDGASHLFQTPNGWIRVGAQNTSHGHITTDRSNFYFNVELQVNGAYKIYADTSNRFEQGVLVLRNSNPTIYFRDTDNNTAMLHCNSNLMYILRGATDSESWTQVSGYWPVYWDLTNNNATFGGAIWAAGNVTAYSDAKLKENVETVDNALSKTLQLRGVYYTRKDDENKERRVGVIAQEVKEVLPEVVRLHKDKEDPEGTYAVDYGNITGLLIEAIKEQQEQIEELREMVKQLCSKL